MNVQTQLGNSRKTQNLCGIKGEKRKEKFVIPFSLKQRNKEKGKKFNGTQTKHKKRNRRPPNEKEGNKWKLKKQSDQAE